MPWETVPSIASFRGYFIRSCVYTSCHGSLCEDRKPLGQVATQESLSSMCTEGYTDVLECPWGSVS